MAGPVDEDVLERRRAERDGLERSRERLDETRHERMRGLPLHADGTVTLIRQLRPAVGVTLLEVPAGRLGKDEEPIACGRRELLEETGLSAETLFPLGLLHPSPGVFDEAVHLFLATGLNQGIAQPEAYEEIETVRLPLTEAVAMALDGRISDGKTIAALFRGAGRNA